MQALYATVQLFKKGENVQDNAFYDHFFENSNCLGWVEKESNKCEKKGGKQTLLFHGLSQAEIEKTIEQFLNK